MNLDQYKQTALDMVKSSTILEEGDLSIIEELQEELVDTFKKSQVFRTRTEMEISVLNDLKHPTPDGKYWQAVREQNVMYTELVMLSYDYRKSLVELKKMRRDMGKPYIDPLDVELMQIECERIEFSLKQKEKVAKDRIREIKHWHEIKENLKPQLKYSEDDVNEHQLETYTKRFINQRSAMGETGSPSERANLIGQLQSTAYRLQERDSETFNEILDTLKANGNTNLLE